MTAIFGQINSFLDYENEVLTPDWLNSGHEIPSQGEKLQPSKRLSRFFPSFRGNLTLQTTEDKRSSRDVWDSNCYKIN